MDLTNSNKYYNGARDFAARGVEYLKIREPGHSEVPKRESVTRFCQVPKRESVPRFCRVCAMQRCPSGNV